MLAIYDDVPEKREKVGVDLLLVRVSSLNGFWNTQQSLEDVEFVKEVRSFFGELLADFDNSVGSERLTLDYAPVMLDDNGFGVEEKVRIDLLSNFEGYAKDGRASWAIWDDNSGFGAHGFEHLHVGIFGAHLGRTRSAFLCLGSFQGLVVRRTPTVSTLSLQLFGHGCDHLDTIRMLVDGSTGDFDALMKVI